MKNSVTPFVVGRSVSVMLGALVYVRERERDIYVRKRKREGTSDITKSVLPRS